MRGCGQGVQTSSVTSSPSTPRWWADEEQAVSFRRTSRTATRTLSGQSNLQSSTLMLCFWREDRLSLVFCCRCRGLTALTSHAERHKANILARGEESLLSLNVVLASSMTCEIPGYCFLCIADGSLDITKQFTQ